MAPRYADVQDKADWKEQLKRRVREEKETVRGR